MAYPYRLNEQAYEEYIAAYEWYELKHIGLGKHFMESVEKKLRQISEHPEYYSRKQENFRVAKIENFPFVIVYEFLKRKQLIHIAAIYHNKRNPKRRYRRKS
ncbi:MAG: type II toxin-antitoxin system RelE/ParE family toxin [Flavisolibacter sp.]|nr:type II toxin-antitoxin system RelE/ParE family toxin [Flavisolibacter sp.]